MVHIRSSLLNYGLNYLRAKQYCYLTLFLVNDVILKYKQGNILPKKRKAEGSVGIIACIMDIVINYY